MRGVWTPQDFLDLGTRDAVDKTLQRLTHAGILRRAGRGLYDKPSYNSLTKTDNPPDALKIIEAIARRDQIRVLVDGKTAANDLGLTNAVPSKIVVHTDARLKSVTLGELEIKFKLTSASCTGLVDLPCESFKRCISYVPPWGKLMTMKS